MINRDLFGKYKQALEKAEENRFDLFGPINWNKIKESGRCPWGHKLYPMSKKPLMYCKSKKHPSFVMKKWK